MTFRGVVGDVVETGRGAGVFSLEWRIPGFSSLAGEAGDCYKSPVFYACDNEWCFLIQPFEFKWDPSSSWLNLALRRLSLDWPQTLNATLAIKGLQGVKYKRRRIHEFLNDDCFCFWSAFCQRSNLTEQNSRLMQGNRLIFTLDMKMDAPHVATGIEMLAEDFGKLLDSGENSDVTVQVGDTAFKAHRAILSVRSPVLCAMFKHDTAERASNKIIIEDCEPDVFREYLHYIYSGFVQLRTVQNVFDLYRVADKYLADNLKLQCLEHMRVTLCVESFCDTVKLAVTHGETDLLNLAVDFATKNIRAIVSTVEWLNFMREYPTEANEIVTKSLDLLLPVKNQNTKE